jgi:hypothetical protein
MGLAPHSAAKDASLRRRLMFCPAVTSSVPGVAGGDGDACGRGRRCLGHQRCEVAVERGDLGVEVDDAACERAQRGFRGMGRLVQASGVGPEA